MWGQRHQTAPTESIGSPQRPPTIAFVLATVAHPQGLLCSGLPLAAEACSTKEPKLYSTRKRNYKTHVPGERVSAWQLLPKCGRRQWPPCYPAPAPPSHGWIQPLWNPPANTTCKEQLQHPSTLTLLRTINNHVVWLLDRQKGWWKLCLPSCWWKTAELPTYANKREGTFLDERVSAAKHSQNHQPLPKLGMLIHPAATIHIGCLSVTGKQLPKPSEVHISILKLRLF